MSKRQRCYAYGRADGSVAWVAAKDHAYLQRYPTQVKHFHYIGFLGTSQLLTQDQRVADRRGPLDAR